MEIVIIEDTEKYKEDGLVWELRDIYGDDNVNFFLSPDEGLEYVKNNIEKNLIVLLDIDFPDGEKNGHQILEEISTNSELIPVILWSGINENTESFSDFINNRAFGFLSKQVTIKEALYLIKKAQVYLETSVDNAIEDWIIAKEEDKDKPIYLTSDGDSFSLNEILKEIRTQTNIGKEFTQKLNKLTIDLLLRKKENL